MASREEHSSLTPPRFGGSARVLIVAAPYYRAVADDLIAGARAVIAEAEAEAALLEVPGALEVPTAIRLAETRFDAFVALGCVIRGETTHYETVCNDSSRALALLGIERGLCIGNGILTCETMAQAVVRAAPGEMNKGGGAAAAALHLLAVKRRFAPRRDAPSPEGGEIRLAGDPNGEIA